MQVTRRLVGAPLAAVFTQRVRHMPAVGVAAAQVPGGDADQRCRLVHFDEGQRKDDVLQKYLAGHDGSERVLFVGRAQEKTRVISSVRRRNRSPGPATRGWGAEARWSTISTCTASTPVGGRFPANRRPAARPTHQPRPDHRSRRVRRGQQRRGQQPHRHRRATRWRAALRRPPRTSPAGADTHADTVHVALITVAGVAQVPARPPAMDCCRALRAIT